MRKRMQVLGKRRTMVVVTMAVLLLAAAVVIGSGANFTAVSYNPDNTFTAAKFRIDNNKEAEKIINVDKMKPGDTTGPQSVTITLDSDVPGAVTLTLDDITDAYATGGAPLSDLLRVTIYDVSRSAWVYNDGALTEQTWALPNLDGGENWDAGETHTFQVTVRWPNGSPAVDNLRKNATTTFDLTWRAASL